MLLREVGRLLDETGYTVGNIDATVLCQAPKLAPHIPAMRQNICQCFGPCSGRCERESYHGRTPWLYRRGLGIAAHAVALIEKSNLSLLKAAPHNSPYGLSTAPTAAARHLRCRNAR